LVRHSLKYVPRRGYDQVVNDLKPIYTATDVDAAQEALERFDHKWGQQLPPVVRAWRDNREYVIPFMAFPPDVRRAVYTTDENVNGGTLISRSRGACGGARLAARGVARWPGCRRNRVRVGGGAVMGVRDRRRFAARSRVGVCRR
jgi:hypothetical protein